MLTVNILGHTHVTYKGNLVPLSAKAVALITYLALERLPQHRERLSDLLWSTAEARKNLRVELARIRSAGLDIFPRSRQLLYLEQVTTDLEIWRSRLSSGMDQPELAHWLAMLRGLPLSGMEDLGSTALQEWVDQQRCAVEEQVEQVLAQAHRRFNDDQKPWATRTIQARAAALGYHLDFPAPELEARPMPALPRTAAPPTWTAETLEDRSSEDERQLRAALERARQQPQIVVIHGPLGSGKSYLTERVLQAQDWLTIRVRSTRLSRLVIASIAQELSRVTDAADAETLHRLLLHPGTLEEDTVKLSTVLARLPTPVALVLDHTQNAPVELASLLEFILHAPCDAPRAAVLLSRTPPGKAPLCRSIMRRFEGLQCTEIEKSTLSVQDVEQILLDRSPHGAAPVERAAEFLQRSEGNVLHLLSLLNQPAADAGRAGLRVPALVREQYAGELDGWPEPLREALGRLSVINGDFNLRLMQGALDIPNLSAVDQLLKEALNRTALIEREPDAALSYPTLQPLITANPQPLYAFRSEGLRVSLAGSLPHEQRQAVRRRLASALEDDEPGLALYYAERVGQEAVTERLRRAYRARLPADSPLLGMPAGYSGTTLTRIPPVQPPPRLTDDGPATAHWQGYTLSRSGSGWLSIVSHGRSGLPRTLRLQIPLPPTRTPRSLRLVWRADVFQGGIDLGPLQVPFALRVQVAGEHDAYVFSPDLRREYREDGVRHLPQPGLSTEVWMAHQLSLPPGQGSLLELSVRGIDVAVTLGQLQVDGVELLGSAAESGTPERGAVAGRTSRSLSRLN